jgi:uncharacterized phage protein gp47/JayE
MTDACGCCEGVAVSTPQPSANRPGLSALSRRVGTHAAFLGSMLARLSSSDHPELAALRTRDPADFSVALLDAWATVADVLAFYQERIANEGYLRTATERLSVQQLARLAGYALRPGVAASVFLAYTLDPGVDVEIPAGSRAQSVPGPGQLPQSFETSERLAGRAAWNDLTPRRTRPQAITNAGNVDKLHLAGTATGLRPGDQILIVAGSAMMMRQVLAVEVQPPSDPAAAGRTRVTLVSEDVSVDDRLRPLVARYLDLAAFCVRPDDEIAADIATMILASLLSGPSSTASGQLEQLIKEAKRRQNTAVLDWFCSLLSEIHRIAGDTIGQSDAGARSSLADLGSLLEHCPHSVGESPPSPTDRLLALVGPLSRPPSLQPRSALRLGLDAGQALGGDRDTAAQLVAALHPASASAIYDAWSSTPLASSPPAKIYALRVRAPVFGYNAPARLQSNGLPGPEWLANDKDQLGDEQPSHLFLDNAYERITGGQDSYAVVERPDVTKIIKVLSARVRPRTAYGISGRTTDLHLASDWWSPTTGLSTSTGPADQFDVIRGTIVHAQSELLPLAEEPIESEVCGDTIELGALYDGLLAGRWVAISGERTDVPGTTGVRASEVVMLAGVRQSAPLDGDSVHSTLILANRLAYRYRRDTVTIQGNVVPATHGETRQEVLGSGDASRELQSFTLHQRPLTYVSAPTPDGVASTLHVRVDGLEWLETDSLAGRGPADRVFVTETDDQDRTAIVLGTGRQGARPPSGVENVSAVYRSGIGSGGNVAAEAITLLTSKPLGVRSVVNPLRASGGADRETGDQARRNVALAMQALDRLVSVSDYAAVSRRFGGVGKAVARRLTDGRRQLVHVTIAGAGDIPIDETSDLLRNLRAALRDFGDPFLPVVVAPRELLLLVVSAAVRVAPAYRWEDVAQAVRAALLEAFGFERRDLGQSVALSEVVSVIQQVPGVGYVQVRKFGSVPESVTAGDLTELGATLQRLDGVPVALARLDPSAPPGQRLRPAQLAYLTPAVKETIILAEATS